MSLQLLAGTGRGVHQHTCNISLAEAKEKQHLLTEELKKGMQWA